MTSHNIPSQEELMRLLEIAEKEKKAATKRALQLENKLRKNKSNIKIPNRTLKEIEKEIKSWIADLNLDASSDTSS